MRLADGKAGATAPALPIIADSVRTFSARTVRSMRSQDFVHWIESGAAAYRPIREPAARQFSLSIQSGRWIGDGFRVSYLGRALIAQATSRTSRSSAVTLVRASPNNMRVLSLKKSGLSMPANPGAMLRFSTTMAFAWSTFSTGMP